MKPDRIFCFLFLLLVVVSLMGCIRLSGSAGYSQVKDEEVVTKSTGFDLDSAKLLPRGPSVS